MDALVAATTATAATALVAILGPAARAGLVIACPGSTSAVAPAIITSGIVCTAATDAVAALVVICLALGWIVRAAAATSVVGTVVSSPALTNMTCRIICALTGNGTASGQSSSSNSNCGNANFQKFCH
jgi:hypothetical protein